MANPTKMTTGTSFAVSRDIMSHKHDGLHLSLLGSVLRLNSKLLNTSAAAVYGSICIALLLLLGLTVWGSYHDYRLIRTGVYRTDIAMLRDHAYRVAGRLEHAAAASGSTDLATVSNAAGLEELWQASVLLSEDQHFAALVRPDGFVVDHTNPKSLGRKLEREWYVKRLPEAGERVVEAESEVLTGGELSIVVAAPIRLNDREIGEYHSGMKLSGFDEVIEQHTRQFLARRAALVAGVLLVVLLAATSLLYLARNTAMLRRSMEETYVEQSSELTRLVAGLAHEIRNPLHALQLNLHTFRKAQSEQSMLDQHEIERMLDESNREINRIESLMHELVGFATPEEPKLELIDLSAEVAAAVDFVGQEMIRQDIAVKVHSPATSVTVKLDRGRLRQILLNLLHNAADAMPAGGKVDVIISSRRGQAHLIVADNGPGVPEANRKRIFEPFYTEKPEGSGLGLALVKRFVEQSRGKIQYRSSDSGGAAFQMTFPEARS